MWRRRDAMEKTHKFQGGRVARLIAPRGTVDISAASRAIRKGETHTPRNEVSRPDVWFLSLPTPPLLTFALTGENLFCSINPKLRALKACVLVFVFFSRERKRDLFYMYDFLSAFCTICSVDTVYRVRARSSRTVTELTESLARIASRPDYDVYRCATDYS